MSLLHPYHSTELISSWQHDTTFLSMDFYYLTVNLHNYTRTCPPYIIHTMEKNIIMYVPIEFVFIADYGIAAHSYIYLLVNLIASALALGTYKRPLR